MVSAVNGRHNSINVEHQARVESHNVNFISHAHSAVMIRHAVGAMTVQILDLENAYQEEIVVHKIRLNVQIKLIGFSLDARVVNAMVK